MMPWLVIGETGDGDLAVLARCPSRSEAEARKADVRDGWAFVYVAIVGRPQPVDNPVGSIDA